jgi:TatD family-associated radical SAM protein
MDIVYAMPGQQHRLFINVVHACPNACIFCVDFKGDAFYGFDLKRGKHPKADEIIAAVDDYPLKTVVREVYYCGIGEPLLRYDTVMDTVESVRKALKPGALVAINTSGTFYIRYPRIEFVDRFDLIQVSLNAENEAKYNAICRPKHPGAYRALMSFLHDLRAFLDRTGSRCRVELSVVDTSDRAHLPASERNRSAVPQPDIDACAKFAAEFGWPLKVKSLLKDCEDERWAGFAATTRAALATG